jgi:hypothetical protein
MERIRILETRVGGEAVVDDLVAEIRGGKEAVRARRFLCA